MICSRKVPWLRLCCLWFFLFCCLSAPPFAQQPVDGNYQPHSDSPSRQSLLCESIFWSLRLCFCVGLAFHVIPSPLFAFNVVARWWWFGECVWMCPTHFEAKKEVSGGARSLLFFRKHCLCFSAAVMCSQLLDSGDDGGASEFPIKLTLARLIRALPFDEMVLTLRSGFRWFLNK